MSRHTPDSVGAMLDRSNSGPIDRARNLVRRLSGAPSIHDAEEGGQDSVMKREPRGLYEQFRRGLLEYHSEVRVAQCGTDLRMNENISKRVGKRNV